MEIVQKGIESAEITLPALGVRHDDVSHPVSYHIFRAIASPVADVSSGDLGGAWQAGSFHMDVARVVCRSSGAGGR